MSFIRFFKDWVVLSDEQMSKRWPFSLLNDEQMSNWVGVEHLPVKDTGMFVFSAAKDRMGLEVPPIFVGPLEKILITKIHHWTLQKGGV